MSYNFIKDSFRDLVFEEESHTYWVKNKKIPNSVSSMIKNFVKPFPLEEASFNVAKKKLRELGVNNPCKECLNEVKQNIKDIWKKTNLESTTKGNEIHLFGENYPINKNYPLEEPYINYKKQIKLFWDKVPQHIEVVFTELRMYDFKLRYAGTCDILLYDKIKEEYIIGDYKTNKDLNKNYNNYLLYPFNDLKDTPLNHYHIQFSYYKLMLEQLNIKIREKGFIIHLKEDSFEKINLIDYSKLIK